MDKRQAHIQGVEKWGVAIIYYTWASEIDPNLGSFWGQVLQQIGKTEETDEAQKQVQKKRHPPQIGVSRLGLNKKEFEQQQLQQL